MAATFSINANAWPLKKISPGFKKMSLRFKQPNKVVEKFCFIKEIDFYNIILFSKLSQILFCLVSCQKTSQRQFVHRLLCKNMLLTFFAVEPVPIVIGLTQSHKMPDVRSRGAISQHLLLDFETVA